MCLELNKILNDFKHPSYRRITFNLKYLIDNELVLTHIQGGFLVNKIDSLKKSQLLIDYIGQSKPDECRFIDDNTVRLWWD